MGIFGTLKAQVSVTATGGVAGPTPYTTLKAAFDAINAGTHQDDVTILLSASTTETATAVLNGSSSPSSYTTVEIRPTVPGIAVQGNLPTAIVKLNGADNVTIDGFITVGPARELTFRNTSTVASSGVIWVASASASNGAASNTIRNCIVTGSSATTTLAAIGQSSGTTFGGTAETANSNNSYLNNLVTSALYGIRVFGAAASEDQNTIISGNTINTLGHGGVFASTQNNVLISQNTISAVTSTTGSFTFQTSGVIVQGTLTGGAIERNTIFNIRIASVWGCNGIMLDATNVNTNMRIYNNFVSDVASGGFSGFNTVDDNGVGIAVNRGGGYKIQYNSVDLSTNALTSTAPRSAAIWFAQNLTAGSVEVRNNIFANRQTTGAANRYAIYSNSPNTIFSVINNNDYFSLGSVGFLGAIQTSLVNWQTATEQDDLSVAVNPFFTSPANLHLLGNSPLDGLAFPIAGITTDIDDEARNATTPDIGADEFTPPNCTNPVTGGTASATNVEICASGSSVLSSTGYSFGVGIAYQWEVSTDNVSFSPLGTQTNPLIGNTGVINATRYYRLRVQCNSGTAGYSNTITITVNNPVVTAGPNVSRCGIGTVDLTATGTNLQWYAASTGGTVLGTGSPFTTPVITGTTTYYVSAASAGVNGSGGKLAPTLLAGYNGLTGLVFDATQAFTLLSVKMYPQAAGQVTIQAVNSAGTLIPGCSHVENFPGPTSTGYVVNLNFPIPVGTSHRLVVSNNASNIVIWRDFSGNTYPYILGTVGSITSGWISGNSATYYYFFDWKFTTRCESIRQAVTAIVTPPPTFTSVSPAAGPSRTICGGSSVTLNAVGGGYTNYTWNPGALPNGSVVTPATTTTYTLTADVPGGCRRDSAITITVNSTPTPLIILPSNVSLCPNFPYQVNTTGGLISGQTFFAETAEIFPFTQFTLTGGNVNVGQNTAYFQQGAGSIHLTHGVNANGSIETGNIPLTGITNPSLTFYQIAGLDAATTSQRDVGYVEFSTDGGTVWAKFPPASYSGAGTIRQQLGDGSPAGVGFNNTSYPDWDAQFSATSSTPGTAPATNLWKLETISLNAWAGFPNFKVRFRILANGSVSYYGWLIDNIKVTGTGRAPITWSSNVDLFETAGHTTNIPANSGNWPAPWYWTPVNAGPTTYTATATGGVGCTTSATVTIAASSAPPSVSITANPAGPICSGQPVTFTAIPVNGGAGAAFNWTVNGGTVSSGSQVGLNVFTIPNLTNSDTVRVIMSIVPSVCPSGPPVISNAIVMVVNPSPVANPISGSTGTSICIGTPNLLTETPTGTITGWQWFLGGTQVSTNPNTYNATLPGSYTVAVTTAAGCVDTSAAFNVSLTTNTITATSGPNGSITPSGAVTVDCGANQTFTMTPNVGYSVLNVLVNGVSVGAPTSYTFTNVTGDSTISVTFYIFGCGSPATSYAGPNDTICSGPNFTLSPLSDITGVATGTWTTTGTGTFNPNNSFASATSYTPSANDITAGSVRLVLTSADPGSPCLPSTDTMILTIKRSPEVAITGRIGLCTAGATTTWLVADTSATLENINTFQWTFGGPVGTNNDSLFVAAAATGNYSVLVTGSNGCTGTDAVTVNTFAPPTVSISGTGPICTDAGVDLNATGVAGSGSVDPNGFLWYIGGVLITGANTAVLTATAAGNYTAQATNSNGCRSSGFSNQITLALDNSPLIGDYTIGVGPASCTNYLSFATAINDLNTRSISGDVRFSVPGDYTETLNSPGLILGGTALLNNATNSGFKISFLKSTAGANPLLTAFTGGTSTPTSPVPNGMFKLRGVNNVSIIEIDLAENPANSGNSLMEFGYGIFKYTATDGAQNNIIQNCNITLSKANSVAGGGAMSSGSTGIIILNSVDITATTAITPGNAAGTNSNNKIYGNLITDCNNGIWVSGYEAPSPFTLADFGNDIGGTAIETGNRIINFGNTGDVSAPNGIRIISQWGVNASFNTIDNNDGGGANTTVNLNGIVGTGGTSAGATISNNIISLKSGATGGQTVVGIDNSLGNTAASNTVTINGNSITGSGIFINSGAWTGIRNAASAAIVNVNGNTVRDIILGGTGIFSGILNSAAAPVFNVNDNLITGNSRTGTGVLNGISTGGPVLANITGNIVSDNTIAGGAAACVINCITGTGGSTSSYTLDNNRMSDNSITNMSGAAVGSIYGYINGASPTTETLTDNIVRNLFVTGAAGATGVHIIRGLSNNTSGSSNRSYLRNEIDSLYTNADASGAIVGIWTQAAGNVIVANNKIHSLFPGQQGAGAAFAKGIAINSGTTSVKVFNNMISLDLSQAFAPAANNVLTGSTSVSGIELTAGTVPVSIYFNTIRLAGGGSGAAFGSSGISIVTPTAASFDLRNNMVVNLMTAGGTGAGVSAALRRAGGATYATTSNNNLWYTTQTATTPIYYFGSAFATLAAFKTAVGPVAEQFSIGDLPVFVNPAQNDLHLTLANCNIDGAGTPIATYTTDFDTDPRDPVLPDIGADEFAAGGSGFTWKGLNTDWMNPANWCGGVPTVTSDVVIPAGTNFYPIITTNEPVARNITINVGGSIVIDPTGVLSTNGVWTNNGIVTNTGTIVLDGTTNQVFPGLGTGSLASMHSLTVDNVGGATINKDIILTGTLKPRAGNIAVNSLITLKSDLSGTARVDTVQGTITYGATGRFSVERYISSRIGVVPRIAWRFLAAPIKPLAGSQTINQAWQEGQAPGATISTGYGMQIVGPASAGPGFDMNNALTSVKKYNPVTNSWVTIPGTSGQISATDGYMAFIRGDRGSSTFGSNSATTLRMAGEIKTGPVTLSTANANINTFISVGNPYPSAIDFASPSTTKLGLADVYYLWDPKLGTFGGYQTFAGPGYVASPGGASSSYPSNSAIESGQAFFVVSNGSVAPHSITINEGSKSESNVQVARASGLNKYFSTRLYLVTAGERALYDGNRIDFDPAYSNDVDDIDAPKLTNFGENLGILRNGKTLSVERHAEIVNTDTLFYRLGELRQVEYQLEFVPENLATTGLTAYLQDAYLNTNTVIGLEGMNSINFTVNGDAASKAPNRFRIVFRQLGPVPVTFTNVTAQPQDKHVMVGWKVEQELNIASYQVERSANGINFEKIGTEIARGGSTASNQQYQWLDENPLDGENFYRIKSIGIGNDTKNSEIVKVTMGAESTLITVYPNPVTDNILRVSLTNLPKGNYDLRLFGMTSQLVLRQGVKHPGGSQRLAIPVSAGLAKGVYNLEIRLGSTKKWVMKVKFE